MYRLSEILASTSRENYIFLKSTDYSAKRKDLNSV